MSTGLDQQTAAIYAPVRSRLDLVEQRLRGLTGETNAELKALLDYILSSGGKRVRPAITLLASDFHPHDQDNSVTMAAATELLHLATLIHDDTVDNAEVRRGRATISNIWGKNLAVLLGDYVFAASATFVCDTNNIRVIHRFSQTIMELASGEIAELFNCFNPQQAREQYYDRIFRKTASLFRTAAETGAVLSGAPEPQIQALNSYGYNMGMAFQIVDDLLDFQGDPDELGKPVGNDLRQGVLTLPSIMLLERSPNDNPITSLFETRDPDRFLQPALDLINNSEILKDCNTEVQKYCAAAANDLQGLPDCDALRSLTDLTEYVWYRRR